MRPTRIIKAALEDVGVLENLIPKHSLEVCKRRQWAKEIQGALPRARETVDPKYSRLQCMSLIMSKLQKLKLFGAQCWYARQVFDVPPELWSLKNHALQDCVISPKRPGEDSWVCVGLTGVRFVEADRPPGSEVRGFYFHEDAMESVTNWSAKGDIIQFQVNGVNRCKGVEPIQASMVISLYCPSSIDIVYTIHSVWRERQARLQRNAIAS